MSDPFAPPKASLDVPVDRGPVPANVRRAATLVAISAGLQVLWIAGMWLGIFSVRVPPEARLGSSLSGLVGVVIFGALAWKIHAGANWARWVFTVWIGLGVVGLLVSLAFVPAAWNYMGAVDWLSALAQSSVNVAAVVFLFTRPAREWFARH